MGIYYNNPKFMAFDSSGTPLSGGKLYTYEAGTSTPLASYSDVACTTPNTNPVVLNSYGEATVCINAQYKFILKTSADVTLWTIDDIDGRDQIEIYITAKGDLIIGNASGNASTLTIGSTNQVPHVVGGTLVYRALETPVELTNESGSEQTAGTVMIADTSNNSSATTNTAVGCTAPVVVAAETIADGSSGRFYRVGVCTVKVYGPVTRGNYLRISEIEGRAKDAGASQDVNGVFAQALTAYAGTGASTVTALLIGSTYKTSTSTSDIIATNVVSYESPIFGDGSDGDATISTNTTLAVGSGAIKVMRYNDLTVDAGIYLQGHADDKVLVILVKGTLTLNGTIKMDGRGGAGGAGQASDGGNPGAKGAIGGGGGGPSDAHEGAGGGGGGQAGAPRTDASGLGGGRILDGAAAKIFNISKFSEGGFMFGEGGNGGPANTSAGTAGQNYWDTSLKSGMPFDFVKSKYGGGGGGGGGQAGVAGKAGGAGGGVVWIEARVIVWGASGLISANGVAGTAGAAGYGGGGGGGGGTVIVIFETKSGTATITATGGAAGADGGASSWAGGAGADGCTGEFCVNIPTLYTASGSGVLSFAGTVAGVKA